MKNFYPDEIIEEVRTSNDIVDVISEYVSLKRGGKNYFGVCPFHNEKTPSFSVAQDKQIFHCFGCGAGGNVISFIMKVENIGFVEALQILAKRARIELPEENVSDDVKKRNNLKEQIYNVNKEAARFYFQNLTGDKGAAARDYIAKRGIDSKTMIKFGIGYALDEWDSLNKYLLDKGFSQDIIFKAGLSKQSRQSNYIDVFRNRIMFPIFDPSGKVIGFGGRTMDSSLPKYLNSQETIVFNKSRNLYALNIARSSDSKKLILAEGYMDVIALHQFGIDYAVATLGTALTPEQAKLAKKYADEIILSYDSDTAGQNAALRGIEVLNDAGCSIKVLHVPDGKDPDEYVRKQGVDKFKLLLSNARTHIQYKIDILKKQINIENVDGKIKFLNKTSDILAKIDNTIERDAYIRGLSNETGISTESILAQVNKILYKDIKPKRYIKTVKKDYEITIPVDKKLDDAEKTLIFLICQQKQLFEKYSESINIDMFTYPSNKNIASIVFSKLASGQEADAAQIIDELSEESDINTVSQIFSSLVDYEDIEKAMTDCLGYINETQKKSRLNELLKYGQDIQGDISKIKELDQLIRNRDRKA